VAYADWVNCRRQEEIATWLYSFLRASGLPEEIHRSRCFTVSDAASFLAPVLSPKLGVKAKCERFIAQQVASLSNRPAELAPT